MFTVEASPLYDRQKAYRQTAKYKAARARYRRTKSKWTTDESYLARPVVAYDGEGVTIGDSHYYTMLAAMSSDDMVYRAVENKRGLKTATIFRFLLDMHRDNPNAIHIIYGGSYDFNMWLADLSRAEAERLYTAQSVYWRDYRLAWKRGKSFTITQRDPKQTITIFDVVSFFQRSFVTACDEYLGERFERREMIVANKAGRSTFTLADSAKVAEYNEAELRNLIRLFIELRERLNNVNLRPRRWDGPGAIAAALLDREGVRAAIGPVPDAVAEAARYAYAGGRFEDLQFGHVESPAWEYDINSAYPAALSHVPNLVGGYWENHSGPPQAAFSLIRVSWEAYDLELPGPCFIRAENGTISYPARGTNWIWRPEYDVLVEYCRRGYGTFTIHEVWDYWEPDKPKPFAFIPGLYRKRQALKRARDGAHVGLKLALNSLYGKLAQQIGARYDSKSGWKIPPYHCLEWAGYTTAFCRATVLRAVLNDLDAVIAFETDAVFTTRPLDVPLSDALGEFGVLEFSDLTYVQSGLYMGTTLDGEYIEKSRGIDRAVTLIDGTRQGGLNRAEIVAAMAAPYAVDRVYNTQLTRFITLGLALSQDYTRWRRWETLPKTINLAPTGKRIHIGCDSDTPENPYRTGVWHRTLCPVIRPEKSHEFPIVWINNTPEMIALQQLREQDKEYD